MNNKRDLLLAGLNKVQPKGEGRWMACCPAHDDKSPSLAIREMPDGRILLKCFAGCDAIDVVHAVGMTLGDLFPDTGEVHPPLAFAKYEKRQEAQKASTLASERMVLEMADAARKRGERLSQKDLDRELQAFKALRLAGADVR